MFLISFPSSFRNPPIFTLKFCRRTFFLSCLPENEILKSCLVYSFCCLVLVCCRGLVVLSRDDQNHHAGFDSRLRRENMDLAISQLMVLAFFGFLIWTPHHTHEYFWATLFVLNANSAYEYCLYHKFEAHLARLILTKKWESWKCAIFFIFISKLHHQLSD